MPTYEEQFAALVLIGIAPAVATSIIEAVSRRDGRLMTSSERNVLAETTSQQLPGLRAWWYANEAVPNEFKRILDAVRID